MSVAGDIVTALLADVRLAIAGVTTTADAIAAEDVKDEELPYAALIQTDYETELLDWGQERRVWTIEGIVIQDGGTREDMQTKLEAIGSQIAADRTLGSTVDDARFSSSLAHSHPDAPRIFGEFTVTAALSVADTATA